MKKSGLLIPVALLMAIGVRAQSIGPATINATGGTTTIGADEVEWSVGEMTLVNTFTTPGIVVTQGVLQPVNITLNVPVTGELSKALRVFPNPAADYVNIEYTSSVNGTLSCRLLDMTGKEISSRIVTVANGQGTGQVDVRALAAATYMLEVTVIPDHGASFTAPYKIQKLQ